MDTGVTIADCKTPGRGLLVREKVPSRLPRWGTGVGLDPAAAPAAAPAGGTCRIHKGGLSKLRAFIAPAPLSRVDEKGKRFSICLQRAVMFSFIRKADRAENVTAPMTVLYKC